jgi:hypothetical protein
VDGPLDRSATVNGDLPVYTLEKSALHYIMYFNREEITKSKLNELTEDKA